MFLIDFKGVYLVKITLRSKAEIKKQLEKLIDLFVDEKLDEAENTADDLDKAIVKYFVSRNLNYEKIREIIKKMKWTLKTFLCHSWRKEKFYKQLKELYQAFESADSEQSIKDRIIRITTDLKEDFPALCITGRPDDMMALTDDFVALQNLSKEISTYGSNTFDKYSAMMAVVGQCWAVLPRLTPQQSNKGQWTVRVDAVNSLTTNFSQLYPLIGKLIASFDDPNDSSKQKNKSLDDFKQDEIEAMRSRAYHLLVNEKWSLDRIAEVMEIKVDDIITLLDLNKDKK
jgi:hypothetical protein